MSICLIRILALRPPVLQFQLPSLLLVCVLFVLVLLFVVVLSGEPKQKQGRGLVDRKLVQAPPSSNFYCWPSQGGSFILFHLFVCTYVYDLQGIEALENGDK